MLPDFTSANNLSENIKSLFEALGNKQNSSVFYAAQNVRYFLASRLNSFFIYVTSDRIQAREACRILNDYSDGEIVLIPEIDELLLSVASSSEESLAERMSAISKIMLNKVKGAVLSSETLMQYFPCRESVKKAVIEVSKGEFISQDEIIKKLILGGYRREEIVTVPGEFAQRGDLIDIFIAGSDMPIRLEFFGDEIERIRVFAVDTMISVKELEEVAVFPKSDILLSQTEANGALNTILQMRKESSGRLSEILDDMIQKFETNYRSPYLLWALPFFREHMVSILEHLPESSVVIFDEPKTIEEKINLIALAHKNRVKVFQETGDATSFHSESIISKEKLKSLLENKVQLAFQHSTSLNPFFYPKHIANVKSHPLPRFSTNYDLLLESVKGAMAFDSKVCIYAGSDSSAENLKDFFSERGYQAHIDRDFSIDYPLLISPEFLSKGFSLPEANLLIIGTEDIIRKSEARGRQLRRKRERFVMPEIGGYVVHDVHGVGISEGLTRLETRTGINDYYVIKYRGEDRLYLPVSKMDELERYSGGGTPTIYHLGGKEFERIKAKVKESIRAMTFDLRELYRKRMRQKGYVYQPDTYWQKEMEENFEFEETDDQLIAISEMKKDMESGKIMDRLLCGDVGFGKTEVAIRGMFKTVMDGKQAAVMCPTTILCQQHYNTIKERLSPYGLNIEMLSRFVDEKKQMEILEDLESGKTNIVVATHKLLNKRIKFFDLGLLVLDEEQRFGVEQKDKIKVLKNNVNVLSMSATPIPRTLHMALSGIRDISTLETPPKNRLPVETYLVEYSDSLLKDAVLREVARGGQVFILHNRIKGIESFYNHVVDLLGDEISVVYAHGQMPSATLEKRVTAFYNQEYQVLVSTSIIENGIDLPTANTLIVLDSDTMGLSTLYQLRGRVGRSHNLAYAYFTIFEGKELTKDSQKRLEAITKYTELGSGFKIAMEDLEIRGAGNVLGREQHGNMQKVGYDMYCRLINEVLREIEGKPTTPARQIELRIDGDIYLPEKYILSSERRVEFYKQVASISNITETREFIKRYEDTDGTIPLPARRLIKVGLIKNLAQALNMVQVILTLDNLELVFKDKSIFSNKLLLHALETFRSVATLRLNEPMAIVFERSPKTLDEKMDFLVKFLLLANDEDTVD